MSTDVRREWISRISDRGIRHKNGRTPEDYLKAFLEVGREFAFATKDDSWGEFEKLFHIMTMQLYDFRKSDEVTHSECEQEIAGLEATIKWQKSRIDQLQIELEALKEKK